MRKRGLIAAALVVVGAAIAGALLLRPRQAQGLKPRYAKHEFHVAMRDGAKLYTAVYAPKDTSRPYRRTR